MPLYVNPSAASARCSLCLSFDRCVVVQVNKEVSFNLPATRLRAYGNFSPHVCDCLNEGKEVKI